MTSVSARAAGVFLATFATIAMAVPAAVGKPGDRLYVMLFDHDQGRFSNALRTGADFLAGGSGRSFQIVLGDYGVLAAVRGVAMTQRDYVEVKRKHPNLVVTVCKESADSLSRANKGRRVPYLPGIKVAPCNGLRERLDREGWSPALGF